MQLCSDWASKADGSGGDYHGLLRALTALASGPGGRFRGKAGLVGKMMQLRKGAANVDQQQEQLLNGGDSAVTVEPPPPSTASGETAELAKKSKTCAAM
uniref:Uncharacterized protein n=1 Tax=Macrostomum lignano TaxID=282301 RepID=A0A1I8HLP5_9PLAT